ncbi:unnamed protein product, partial [Coregonus sp. 'balchen']
GLLSFLSAPLIGALSDVWGRKWYFAVISMSGVFAVTFSVIFAYVSVTFAASLVTSPAIRAYLSVTYGDTLVVILATAIALLGICFILVAVPDVCVRCARTVLLICITVFLSYLPEAGQSETVAAFIAVVGILAIVAQTVVLGIMMRSIVNKNIILLGLGFQILQLAWYGFGSQPWSNYLKSKSSITFSAISAIVSRNTDPSSIIPGPPFLFGACSVLLSLLVAWGSDREATRNTATPPSSGAEGKEPLLDDR